VNYWIVRGDPAQNDNFAFMQPGHSGRWRTKKPPRSWTAGDRFLFWASSPQLELIALGEFLGETGKLNDEGETLYNLRYLTRTAARPLGITELRADPALADAIFLKRGPAASVLRLSENEGEHLYRLLISRNDTFRGIWPDVETTAASCPDVDASAVEGDKRLTRHFRIERSAALAQKKKRAVFATTGRLKCEVCDFEFKSRYGSLAEDFCEVHHKQPLSRLNGPTTTRLDDLAIVCSNCHRVLHLKRCALSIEELRRRLL